MIRSRTFVCWLILAMASEVKAFVPNRAAGLSFWRRRAVHHPNDPTILAMVTPTKERTSSVSSTENLTLIPFPNITIDSTHAPPEYEMNGDAKVEEPGDREQIMRSIREFQNSLVDEQPRLPVGTIIQRTLDTAEDVFVHLRRVPYDSGWFLEKEKVDRPTIVVLGSGWAAHALLKVADTYKLRIIVVSPSNHFVFTPMLASASVGTVEYRSMTEAVRAANPMIENYLEGKATDIDFDKQVIKVKLNSLLEGIREGDPPEIEVQYDKLIVAVGCKVADSLVPGAFENSLRLKTCDDARRLRNAVGEALEFASRPDVKDNESLTEAERELRRLDRQRRVTFAIVGGGPTGVELAGELSDFFKDITKARVGAYPQLRDDVRIVLIQGGDDLVPQFDEDLREHALSSLRKAGVDVRLSTKVNEVGDGFVKIIAKGEGADEEMLHTGLNIWAAGTEPVPFVNQLLDNLPADARGPQGKIHVDRWLRCSVPETAKFGSILVMGDAAAFSDRDNSYLPQTAQVAGQQGAYAARLLDRDYDLSATPPCLWSDSNMMNVWLKLRGLEKAEGCKSKESHPPSLLWIRHLTFLNVSLLCAVDFLNLGLLAYVGGGEALSQVELGDVPIFSYAGSIAFILWRSVYLVKQVATRNRVLVTFDWLKTYLFGRDITRL